MIVIGFLSILVLLSGVSSIYISFTENFKKSLISFSIFIFLSMILMYLFENNL